jgi:hypothetical protein
MNDQAQTHSAESALPTAAEETKAEQVVKPSKRSYLSNSSRFPSPDEIHEKYKVKFFVHHWHEGNDPKMVERAKYGESKYIPIYVTTCTIMDWDQQVRLGYGEAVCSHKDIPNRSIGHQMAVGRAIKDFMEHLEDEKNKE